jgi:hypothetical protein
MLGAGFRLLLAPLQIATLEKPPGSIVLSLNAARARVFKRNQQQKNKNAQRQGKPPATGASKPVANAWKRRGRLRCGTFSAENRSNYG